MMDVVVPTYPDQLNSDKLICSTDNLLDEFMDWYRCEAQGILENSKNMSVDEVATVPTVTTITKTLPVATVSPVVTSTTALTSAQSVVAETVLTSQLLSTSTSTINTADYATITAVGKMTSQDSNVKAMTTMAAILPRASPTLYALAPLGTVQHNTKLTPITPIQDVETSAKVKTCRVTPVIRKSRQQQQPAASVAQQQSPTNFNADNETENMLTEHYCEMCDKGYPNEAALRSHMYAVKHVSSQTSSKYRCRQCGSRFSQMQNLNRHVRTMHTFEKPYECDFCQLSYSDQDNRNKHEKSHIVGTPFYCPQCNQRFVTPRSVRFHQRLKHAGQKETNVEELLLQVKDTPEVFNQTPRFLPRDMRSRRDLGAKALENVRVLAENRARSPSKRRANHSNKKRAPMSDVSIYCEHIPNAAGRRGRPPKKRRWAQTEEEEEDDDDLELMPEMDEELAAFSNSPMAKILPDVLKEEDLSEAFRLGNMSTSHDVTYDPPGDVSSGYESTSPIDQLLNESPNSDISPSGSFVPLGRPQTTSPVLQSVKQQQNVKEDIKVISEKIKKTLNSNFKNVNLFLLQNGEILNILQNPPNNSVQSAAAATSSNEKSLPSFDQFLAPPNSPSPPVSVMNQRWQPSPPPRADDKVTEDNPDLKFILQNSNVLMEAAKSAGIQPTADKSPVNKHLAEAKKAMEAVGIPTNLLSATPNTFNAESPANRPAASALLAAQRAKKVPVKLAPAPPVAVAVTTAAQDPMTPVAMQNVLATTMPESPVEQVVAVSGGEDCKPYECHFCEVHFKDRDNRNKHEKSHINGTPFVCSYCDMKFKTPRSLRFHQKQKHFYYNQSSVSEILAQVRDKEIYNKKPIFMPRQPRNESACPAKKRARTIVTSVQHQKSLEEGLSESKTRQANPVMSQLLNRGPLTLPMHHKTLCDVYAPTTINEDPKLEEKVGNNNSHVVDLNSNLAMWGINEASNDALQSIDHEEGGTPQKVEVRNIQQEWVELSNWNTNDVIKEVDYTEFNPTEDGALGIMVDHW